MYDHRSDDILLSLELAKERASGRLSPRPPGSNIKAELRKLEKRMTEEIKQAVGVRNTEEEVPARIEAVRRLLGDDADLTINEIADLWGCSSRTVKRISDNPAEAFRLVKIAGTWRASVGAVRRYYREKFGARPSTSKASG